MKFLWTTVYVKDMGKSLYFYTDLLGLEISHRLSMPDMDIIFLGKQQETLLELIEDKALLDVNNRGTFSVGFKSNDAPALIDKLRLAGVRIIGGPIKPNEITKFWFVEDPDGLKVQIVEQED
ncbi:VOC family protein [Mycoplasma sp. P36-A1]|uniref:VOC family protein n=1 Tax=Mycoplasma sp. P36-A1 TaxID=3252900 RepID=UPI003C2B0A1D